MKHEDTTADGETTCSFEIQPFFKSVQCYLFFALLKVPQKVLRSEGFSCSQGTLFCADPASPPSPRQKVCCIVSTKNRKKTFVLTFG